MNLNAMYEKWVNEGSPGDPNNSVPHEIKMYYLMRTLKEHDLKVFVESGTSHGDGVAAMLPYVDEVHTIEAWDEACQFSINRFKGDGRVHIYFGDSAEILPGILDEIDPEPALFWLDAHYSGDGTALLDKETPIVAELEAIAKVSHLDHCIIVDDARGFGVWNDYPTIDWMKDFCGEHFPHHKFSLEGDEIFILPEY